MKEGSINHDLTLDRNLNDLPFFHKKGVSVVLKVVHTQQENELLTAFYKTGSHLVSAQMIHKGKCSEVDNSLDISKFCNVQCS